MQTFNVKDDFINEDQKNQHVEYLYFKQTNFTKILV